VGSADDQEIQDIIDECTYWEWDKDITGMDYQTPLWRLVRKLKRVSKMPGMTGIEALAVVEGFVENWTIFSGIDDDEDGREEFVTTWDVVQLAEDEEPLAAAAERAEKKPYRFKTGHYGAKYQKFLNIGYRLQQIRRNKPIYLPCERLAKILGVSSMRITNYRQFALEEGYLRLVEKHHFVPGSGGRSTAFRFGNVTKEGV
jgi:hypothetical protein